MQLRPVLHTATDYLAAMFGDGRNGCRRGVLGTGVGGCGQAFAKMGTT